MAANTLLTSVVTGGSNNHTTVAEEANAYATDFVSSGVVGLFGLNSGSGGTGSFCVNADTSPDMGVTIKAGQAYVAATPSSQGAQVLRVRAAADYTTYVINANASGSTKFDWIYLTISAVNANNPSAAADNVASFATSRSSSNVTDNGTPPTYGILLAVVTVANGASSITNANISDRRLQSSVSTAGTSNATGWINLANTPTTVTYNGNRSYTCVFNSVDLTGTVSNGMRLKLTRTVTAPIQCASLNGSTQYFSRLSASLTGFTFTGNFTLYAKIKLSAYPANETGVPCRSDASTGGWAMTVLSSGRLRVFYGASSVFTDFITTQLLPLNRELTVAASVNVSAKTAVLLINGVVVPTTSALTAATTVAQTATDLQIGHYSTGFLPAEIAQVAVFNTNVATATLLGYMSQSLTGSEANLVAAYTLSNSVNDLTANANNLTANGSATTTTNDAFWTQDDTSTPNGTTDYGVIVSKSFSTNTTFTVQMAEGCAIPTTGGISGISYSTQAEPYGFPGQPRFRIDAFDTSGTLTNPLIALLVKYVTNNPLDSLGFFNTGNAAGTMYVSQSGSTRSVSGVSGVYSVGTGSQLSTNLTFPTGLLTTIQSAPISLGTLSATAKQLCFWATIPTASGGVLAVLDFDTVTAGGTWLYEVTGT